jgi:hypothetical protein
LAALCVAVATALVTTVPSMVLAQGSAQDHYSRGFSDGCNDIQVSGSHTSDYLAGFAAGLAKCNSSGSLNDGTARSNSDSASSSTSSSTSNGNTMHITIGK